MFLTSFLFANATDEDVRNEALDRHVKSIEKQVKVLAAKNLF